MPDAKPASKTKRTLRTFAAASFLNDLGSDMIYPIWPMFVTEFLKANMTVLGFIDGLGDALVALSQAASGYASDKLRRRKVFIWTGYLCGGLSRLGYAAAAVWHHLVPLKMLDRIGKIRNAPRDAMIADISDKEKRGRNFGLLRTMDNMGAFFGILVSIALFPILGYRGLFLLAAVPSFIAVGLILALIKERGPSERKIFKGMSLRDLDGNLRLFIVLNAVFALGAFSYSFLLIFAKRSGFSAVFVPVLYLIYTAAAMLLSLPFGRLSDRIGRKPVLFLSFAVWAAVCLAGIFGRGKVAIFVVFILYGIHKAALEPVQRTMVTEICPPEFRASAIGALQMIIGLCALPASLVAGLLWEKFGPAAAFGLALGLTVTAAALLIWVKERRAEGPRGVENPQ
jgi:MFS family permease